MNKFLNKTAQFDVVSPFFPLVYRFAATFVYVSLGIVGIVGNLMVITVVLRTKNMITPTNCYLVSLAVSDCLFFFSSGFVEISYIHTAYEGYVFGRVFCSILSYMAYLSINGSAFSIIAFTIERYIGICHPLKARYICTVKRACYIIVLVWCFSVLYNSPWLGLTTTFERIQAITKEKYCVCGFSQDRNSTALKIMFVVDFVMFYTIPMALFFLYGRMAYVLMHNVYEHQLTGTGPMPSTKNSQSLSSSSKTSKVKSRSSSTRKSDISSVLREKYRKRIRTYQSLRTTKSKELEAVERSRIGSFKLPNEIVETSTKVINQDLNTPPSNETIEKFLPIPKDRQSPVMKLPLKRAEGRVAEVSTTVHFSTTSSYESPNKISVRRKSRADSRNVGGSRSQSRKQVVKMLAAIVVIFGVGWLPYRLLLAYNSFAERPWISDAYLFFAKSMIFANCAINPVLYNLMSKKFRMAFRSILSNFWPKFR